MELDRFLKALDRTSANVTKLELIWQRAVPFMPSGPALGSPPEYDDLCRSWDDLVEALPPIDGFTISLPLPDINAIGSSFRECFEASVPTHFLHEQLEAPGRELDEYRYRLNRSRRRAVRERLQRLSADVSSHLDRVVAAIGVDEPDPQEMYETEATGEIREAIGEIERLLGNSIERKGRWSDLSRHLRFAQPHDWRDIQTFDWPSVLEDIAAAGYHDSDPLPVEDLGDLGVAAASELSGAASFHLDWEQLSPDDFERMLYDLLWQFDGHSNVQLLTKENAPDRGRDLSFNRTIAAPTGETNVERVLVQAKHWRSKSVRPEDLLGIVARAQTWSPPFDAIIVATSGHFTSDAVAWTEMRTTSAERPGMTLWAEADLERHLARFPEIAASYNLR